MSVRKGRAVKAEDGSELMHRTGSRQSDTQVACAMKAANNLGGEPRMESKRESRPFSAVMRENRNVPTRPPSVSRVGLSGSEERHGRGGERVIRLVAQTATAALSATCLQFNTAAPAAAELDPPVNAPSKLGNGGFAAPVVAANALPRRAGRYKLNAVQERYVMEPEMS